MGMFLPSPLLLPRFGSCFLTFSKVKIVGYAGLDLETVFKADYPNVYSWFKKIEARPSVQNTYAALSK
jgi:glutathione S-transferase